MSNNDGFFAVDRRVWARVCQYGVNAAVAYVVLGRGTGHDNRTVKWSVNAIEQRFMSRDRAKRAVKTLVESGLVRLDQAGKHPRYYIMPAHEVPGCEGHIQELTADEAAVWDHLKASGETWLSTKGLKQFNYQKPRPLAENLVAKGWAKTLGNNHFRPIVPDAEKAAEPDWIWLPNTIIDGASGEKSPVALLHESQNIAAIRLFVDLYHSHSLRDDGGIHWRKIRQDYERQKIGEHAEYVIWGFKPGTDTTWPTGTEFVRPYHAWG